MSEYQLRLWALGWHHFWIEFGGTPFTAKRFPG